MTPKIIFFKVLRTIAQKHKEEIVDLLGRLDDKYEVEIAIPRMNLERFPMAISLGDKKHGVPLQDWGSGTQNRTKILLSLLQARRMSQSASESDKITPIIIIEEPESFLHPSAQAEFGKLLQDLSKEFQVQVIATTHSPHMLSLEQPNCNLLLCRKIVGKQLRETYSTFN
ncbi:AAA family ATPase [Synechococcus sp. PCC 6312]|uniref:AAA family ATPase n=1 Tax=Synechococcus sp. (strain ATCC 27167 / PCC 6312) TaxID=195253 RepID=UPI0009FC5CE8